VEIILREFRKRKIELLQTGFYFSGEHRKRERDQAIEVAETMNCPGIVQLIRHYTAKDGDAPRDEGRPDFDFDMRA